METTKWLTKLFIHDDGMQDLIIEKTGEVVMSSRNGERIWDERMKLERKLREPKQCQQCDTFMYSETLGSPDADVWHCRYGFSPSKDCQEMAEYNRRCTHELYREFPEMQQLTLNFK